MISLGVADVSPQSTVMKILSICIPYFSGFGHTKRIAETIAEAIGADTHLIDVEDMTDADDPDTAVEEMYAEVTEQKQKFQSEFQTLYDQADYPAAAMTVRKMQFIDKLERDIEALEDKLYD